MTNYIIITPAKNEEKYIEKTIKSVCRQSLLPRQWVIVNDGSTDKTKDIILKYQKSYQWISLIDSDVQKKRIGGANVVDLFYLGYNSLADNSCDFIVKLDADLILPDTYFGEVAKCFKNNPDVGLCGGYIVHYKGDKEIREISKDYHIRGAFKSYRFESFLEMGGIQSLWNWDSWDEMKLLYIGWKTQLLPVKVIHLRPTGKAYNSLRHSYASGKDYYRSGHDLLLATLYATKQLFHSRPVFVRGTAFFIGYIMALILREEKYFDREFRSFLNRFAYNSIMNSLSKR